MTILTRKEIRNSKILFVLLSASFVVGVNLIYCGLKALFTHFSWPFISIVDLNSLSNLIVIAATFSFTMTGFIAAMGTYLNSGQPSFELWRSGGYLSVYKFYYLATLLSLTVTFASCIFYYVMPFKLFIIKQMLIFLALNLIQVAYITAVIINNSQHK
ncbi:hypothetical protein [Vibrio sp. 1CM24A]|uniref:hypothetical protein n=1 Tax=Vibrio sp. 1CM24A TaxID=2929165 RepID=UPI0020BE6646|nr:hypothetical protein [Vibrio sp. 1CM24A]MCK8083772.1 hypothetical protein [Vibrio sp. 1CM24A]